MPGINGHNPQAYLGSWKNWDAVSGNISGTWRTASDVYVNHNGTWKQVWVRLTGPTGGSTSLSDVTATISWTPGVGQEGFKLYRNGSFVKNVAAGATSTTDTLPALQTTYTYTVSAYAGSTETAQISAGTARREVDAPTESNATIWRDWRYVNNDWDGSLIGFDIRCVGPNQGAFEYSTNNGVTWNNLGAAQGTILFLSQDQEVNVRWRARRLYNGISYFSSASPNRNIKSGQPLIRNPQTNFDTPTKTAFRGDVISEFYNFTGGFGIIVDSYEWREVDAVNSSLLCNDTRRVNFNRPGTNISLPFGSSSASGTGDNGGAYVQGPYTNYVDGNYGMTPVSASSGVGGWSSTTSGVYLRFKIRFKIRTIAQTAIEYSIT